MQATFLRRGGSGLMVLLTLISILAASAGLNGQSSEATVTGQAVAVELSTATPTPKPSSGTGPNGECVNGHCSPH